MENANRFWLRALLILFLLVAVNVSVTPSVFAQDGNAYASPNFVLILSDDQSWVGTSVAMMASRADSASDFFRTPQLERLAAQGMVFSDGYAPAPQCSPSRHSIQFGKSPARLRNTCHNRTRNPCRTEISIAQMIKAANSSYVTAHLGKWHIGGRTPTDMGYDVSDGTTGNGNGNVSKVGKEKQPWPDDNPKQIFGLTRRANEFMQRQVEAGRPFYLQISHYATHVENQSRMATEEKYRNLPLGRRHNPNDYDTTDNPNTSFFKYAGMTEDLDTGVGMVLDKIEELGIKNNTFIIYMSDNGGYRVNFTKLNKPLAGGKTTLWEGGVRVPMIVSGPGIKGGTRCSSPVIGYDIFPTICELIGNNFPLPEGIDGGSWCPLFESDGKAEVERPMDGLVFHFPFYYSPQSTIRQGSLKLVKDWVSGEVYLFDLANDLSEAKNLALAKPQKVEELHAKMMSYLTGVDAETIDVLRTEAKRLGKVLTSSKR